MDVSWEDPRWWSGAFEEDTTRSLELDGEDGAWARGFLPPPPRPSFLEMDIPTDGLTTCDLCTWASDVHGNMTSRGSLAFFPWSITLIIVSILSALVGAALMVSFRHCFKRVNNGRNQLGYTEEDREDHEQEGDKRRADKRRQGEGGVWCWLSRRSTLQTPPEVTATNHYTDEAYAGVEALYAELDKPVYQNTGYVLDAEPSSPPSSAYYSDFSERTYETVGNTWEMCQVPLSRQRLSAISEAAVHSDYV
uniref:Unkown protein n=1 Tax=Riptortus pedestris TaxID=329032 RepID=R4WKK7_RIPPE|nr:unkown protein [Riptortus pedestris]